EIILRDALPPRRQQAGEREEEDVEGDDRPIEGGESRWHRLSLRLLSWGGGGRVGKVVLVAPAKAGAHADSPCAAAESVWTPAFAGVTVHCSTVLPPLRSLRASLPPRKPPCSCASPSCRCSSPPPPPLPSRRRRPWRRPPASPRCRA